MDQTTRFQLEHWQVPDFPTSPSWIDQLRWCVAVADADDRDVSFLASLLHHAIEKDGLTEKQAKYAGRSVRRIRDMWSSNELACQREVDKALKAPSLASVTPAGRA